MKNLIITSLILYIIIGCGKQGEKSGLGDSTLQARKQNEIRFDVRSFDETSLKQLINQRNRKFLFLNVWATLCAPCREEFPDLVKLAEEYNSSNVEFVGFSGDYPDEIESKIIPFLKNYKVNFTIYIQNFKDEENIINFLNKEWNGAIPATFIFDTNGAQQAFLFGKHDYNGFRKELENILND